MASDRIPELEDGLAGACAHCPNLVCVKCLGHSDSFGGLMDAGMDDHLLRLSELSCSPDAAAVDATCEWAAIAAPVL